MILRVKGSGAESWGTMEVRGGTRGHLISLIDVGIHAVLDHLLHQQGVGLVTDLSKHQRDSMSLVSTNSSTTGMGFGNSSHFHRHPQIWQFLTPDAIVTFLISEMNEPQSRQRPQRLSSWVVLMAWSCA